ncbi:MAG: NTF2-like N-terminal transpeptidase domain-containing protein [Oscillospiraceae bacterium]|nr:NTF2-like N-terminal transpeptidase domain-containing protein [Oscillospiraceae bacterium]
MDRMKNKGKMKIIVLTIAAAAIVIAAVAGIVLFLNKEKSNPEEVAKQYFKLLSAGKYEEMYQLLDADTKKNVSEETYTERNRNIYEGIEAANIKATVTADEKRKNDKKESVSYQMKMDTSAGEVSFDNEMELKKDEDGIYRVVWSSSDIFPELGENEKVRISNTEARRGQLYDRNNVALTQEGIVAQVGLIPGKMEANHQDALAQIGSILGVDPADIEASLSASYVLHKLPEPVFKSSRFF